MRYQPGEPLSPGLFIVVRSPGRPLSPPGESHPPNLIDFLLRLSDIADGEEVDGYLCTCFCSSEADNEVMAHEVAS